MVIEFPRVAIQINFPTTPEKIKKGFSRDESRAFSDYFETNSELSLPKFTANVSQSFKELERATGLYELADVSFRKATQELKRTYNPITENFPIMLNGEVQFTPEDVINLGSTQDFQKVQKYNLIVRHMRDNGSAEDYILSVDKLNIDFSRWHTMRIIRAPTSLSNEYYFEKPERESGLILRAQTPSEKKK